MGDAAPTKNIYAPSLKKRIGTQVSRVLDAIRAVPHLTSIVAAIGVVTLVFLTLKHSNALLEESPENWALRYKLALSPEFQDDFKNAFFVDHWKLGAKLLLPAFILAIIRQRGKAFALPLTLLTFAFFTLWIVTDLHTNWNNAHNTTMGEVPAPHAYYAKLLLIGSVMLSFPFMLWLYYKSTILDQYVVRSFLAPFLMCLLGIIAIMITMDLLNNANDFLKADFSPGEVMGFYLQQVPQILVMIMDAAVLLATLYTLSKMSRANEIVSMLGAGRSLIRILLPMIVLGAWASLIVMAMNFEWAPGAQSVKDAMLRKADKAGDRANGKARREQSSTYNVMFRNKEENRTWFLGKVPNRLTSYALNIDFAAVFQDDGQGNLLKAYYGKRAAWFPGSQEWRLYDAHLICPEYMNAENPMIPGFDKYTIPEKWAETPWSILSGKINPDYLSVQELSAYLNSYVSLEQKKLARYETTLHSRISLPFRCFLMVLIAAPLGIVTSRRGVLGGVAYSVALFVLVYFTYTIFLKLGEGGHLPPAVAGWGVIGLFALVGMVMLWMKNYNRQLPSFNPANWFKRPAA